MGGGGAAGGGGGGGERGHAAERAAGSGEVEVAAGREEDERWRAGAAGRRIAGMNENPRNRLYSRMGLRVCGHG